MKRFTDAIKKCLDAQNWYGALFLALTMPDICGKITSPNLRSGERYRKWFNKYLSKYYETDTISEKAIFMTASDCWGLRCSLLHAGVDDITEQEVEATISKFYFSTTSSHLIKVDGKLVLNAKRFCEEFIQAVGEWSNDMKDNSRAQERIVKLLVIHVDAVSPSRGIVIE